MDWPYLNITSNIKTKMEKGFSLCYMVFAGDFQTHNIQFYNNQQTVWLEVIHSFSYNLESRTITRTITVLNDNKNVDDQNIPTNFNTSWDKFCLTINNSNSNMVYTLNGNITVMNHTLISIYNTDVILFKIFGMFTQVTLSSLVNYEQEGNIHNWNTSLWNYNKTNAIYVSSLDILQPLIMYVPLKQDIDSARSTCEILGDGVIVAYQKELEWRNIFKFYKAKYPQLDFVHFPYYSDGEFYYDLYDNQNVSGTFWIDNCTTNFSYFAFNGENCTTYSYYGFSLKNYTFFCKLSSPAIFKVNGMPENTDFDQIYYPNFRLPDFNWIGFNGTFIRYKNSKWRGAKYNVSDKILSNASLNNLLVGRSDWTVQTVYSPFEIFFPNLSMNRCEEEQFACGDGSCTAFENRCDGYFDCLDHSDEEECKFILHPDGYDNEEIIPGQWNKKVDMFVNIHLLEILDINIHSGRMDLKLNITLQWYDSRLNYVFLNEDPRQNVLNTKDFISIWKPTLIFANKDTNPYYVNAAPEMSVGLDGSFVDKQFDSSTGTYSRIYPGKLNPLYWTSIIR